VSEPDYTAITQKQCFHCGYWSNFQPTLVRKHKKKNRALATSHLHHQGITCRYV